MSIFEKIKQFFKNIGNKQKLLETPKEIREEMSDVVSSNKKESEFLEDIKFNLKDLLDPRVCNGKDLVPNILRTLGANEDVVNNPQLIEELRVHFQGIANQSGIEMPNYYEQPTRDTINAIVEAVKTNGIVTTSQERNNKHPGLKGHKVYDGISIDQKTGAVTIQRLVMSGREANVLHGNYMHEETFAPDGKGNAVANSFSYDIDSDGYGKAILTGTSEVLYNPDGIAMKLESKSYKQEDGQDILQYHAVNTRDEQYPFIAQQETIVNDFGHGSPVGTEYIAIEMKDLSQLGFPEYQKDENGRTTTTPITFDDREQISKYYQDNKEAIDNALMQEPDHGLFPSKGLKQSLKAGIKKLAIKAGILPNEHEQETEISE